MDDATTGRASRFVEARHNPESGTRTTMSDHPSSAPTTSAAPEATIIDTSLLVGKRVLVCEDEGVIQAQVCRALSQAGLQVIGSALNGKQGVEMALQERPDIVLMDLNLPVIDGMEAARRIMAAYGPCIVIVSSYGDAD